MINLQHIKDIIRTLFELEIILGKYKIGDGSDILNFKDLKLLSIEGHEYIVFLYNNRVIKIHRNHLQSIYALNEENVLSLIGIPTKRILMPTDPLYNLNKNIVGYVMVPVFQTGKNIYEESMDSFLNEINIIYCDMNILNEELVLLKDIHPGNAIFNGKIYIVDSGRYVNANVLLSPYIDLDNKNIKMVVKDNNIDEINSFLYRYIMNCILSNLGKSTKISCLMKVKKYFETKSSEMGTTRYIDIVEHECNRNMTVIEYAKTLKNIIDI
ncbi:MAG: hypothetical protein J6B64_00145 [Bacilli bacterium]|nr:hypothetical protein [Bacilli bacterium]MBP3635541.1 hypothetical protein [Bacilli bacterium]